VNQVCFSVQEIKRLNDIVCNLAKGFQIWIGSHKATRRDTNTEWLENEAVMLSVFTFGFEDEMVQILLSGG
jgi:hypothetical protein